MSRPTGTLAIFKSTTTQKPVDGLTGFSQASLAPEFGTKKNPREANRRGLLQEAV